MPNGGRHAYHAATAEAELLAKLLDSCLDEVEARNRNADRQALRDLHGARD